MSRAQKDADLQYKQPAKSCLANREIPSSTKLAEPVPATLIPPSHKGDEGHCMEKHATVAALGCLTDQLSLLLTQVCFHKSRSLDYSPLCTSTRAGPSRRQH